MTSLRLKMNDDGLARSFGMRERGWGSGMRTHSSSKRTPLASTVTAAVMDEEEGSICDCGSETDVGQQTLSVVDSLRNPRPATLTGPDSDSDAGVAVLPPSASRAGSSRRTLLAFLSVLSIVSSSGRLQQIADHLSNNYGHGLTNMVTLDHRNAVSSVRRSAFIDCMDSTR